ncbi:hypothetical protein VTN00DRAFT_2714 [Thermoascus crustaceus]|uniref:uncharacterized protein n=1 Tax=Thermoascus crustaceus TaxID=5088 RepID=UPI00374241BC
MPTAMASQTHHDPNCCYHLRKSRILRGDRHITFTNGSHSRTWRLRRRRHLRPYVSLFLTHYTKWIHGVVVHGNDILPLDAPVEMIGLRSGDIIRIRQPLAWEIDNCFPSLRPIPPRQSRIPITGHRHRHRSAQKDEAFRRRARSAMPSSTICDCVLEGLDLIITLRLEGSGCLATRLPQAQSESPACDVSRTLHGYGGNHGAAADMALTPADYRLRYRTSRMALTVLATASRNSAANQYLTEGS